MPVGRRHRPFGVEVSTLETLRRSGSVRCVGIRIGGVENAGPEIRIRRIGHVDLNAGHDGPRVGGLVVTALGVDAAPCLAEADDAGDIRHKAVAVVDVRLRCGESCLRRGDSSMCTGRRHRIINIIVRIGIRNSATTECGKRIKACGTRIVESCLRIFYFFRRPRRRISPERFPHDRMLPAHRGKFYMHR